jgi:tripartite-type tricarboxylate transporter receptor subunit TctC
VQAHLKSGALRAIGVGSAARVPAAPEIPTIAEQGLPNYNIEGWFAVVGPAKLPMAEARRIQAAVAAAYATPEVRKPWPSRATPSTPARPKQLRSSFAAKW